MLHNIWRFLLPFCTSAHSRAKQRDELETGSPVMSHLLENHGTHAVKTFNGHSVD